MPYMDAMVMITMDTVCVLNFHGVGEGLEEGVVVVVAAAAAVVAEVVVEVKHQGEDMGPPLGAQNTEWWYQVSLRLQSFHLFLNNI